jgi:fructose/tagatose bisphosphate aldolase
VPHPTPDEILTSLRDAVAVDGEDLRVGDKKRFRQNHVDRLVHLAVFHTESETRGFVRWLIRSLAQSVGVVPASILGYYRRKGEGKFPRITVPAINLRGMTYDTACALFRAAKANNSMTFVLEIAPTEMKYTGQTPDEFAVVAIAAALREGWTGPVFLQGDHFQFNAEAYRADPGAETERVKAITREAVEAGFFNIDIDASTLVRLDAATIEEQQRANSEVTAEMTRFIRSIQPPGVAISVGGEIGEVGGRNSTADDLRAFMDGYLQALAGDGAEKVEGLSKISVQSGTVHGGTPLPDGSVADVAIDFKTLEQLGTLAISPYRMAGVVQHGASTLPESLFERFPQADTAEIHLATAFQNLIFDGGHFPPALFAEIREHLRRESASERREGESDGQFFYRTRKRAFGPFKRKIWELPVETRAAISRDLEKRFDLLFKKLNAVNTTEAVLESVEMVKGVPPAGEKFRNWLQG